MTQIETENPHKKEAGIGWGTIFAGATAVMAFVAAFTGLSHLAEQNHLDLDNPQDSIDNLSGMLREKNGGEQLLGKVKRGVNGVAVWLGDQLDGTGNGLGEAGKSLFGYGSQDEARQIIRDAAKILSEKDLHDPVINRFSVSNEMSMPYNGGWLLRDSQKNILFLDPEKLQGIDPRRFGGNIPNLFSRAFDGQHPATIADLQKATAGKDVIGEIGRNAATAGLVVVGAGLALKASETTNYAASVRQNYRPVNRIDPNDAHIQLALTAPAVNNAFAKV